MQTWVHFVNSLSIVGFKTVEEALAQTKEQSNATTKA